MSKTTIGDLKHFENFLLEQALLYRKMMEEHFGLPSAPTTARRNISIHITHRLEAAKAVNPNVDRMEFDTLFFQKVDYCVGKDRIEIWALEDRKT